MFKNLKKRDTETTPERNRYEMFDDFIRMMIECSDAQFESTCLWLKSMRKPKL